MAGSRSAPSAHHFHLKNERTPEAASLCCYAPQGRARRRGERGVEKSLACSVIRDLRSCGQYLKQPAATQGGERTLE